MLTATDIDSYVIDYVIFDNGIWNNQILLSMTEYQIAKIMGLKTVDINTILRLQQWVQWHQKQYNSKLLNWRHDFNCDVFNEYFMDGKSDMDPLLGYLKSQTSTGNLTSTDYQFDETLRVKLSEYPELSSKGYEWYSFSENF